MTVLAVALFATETTFMAARKEALRCGHHLVGEWLPYAGDALGSDEGEKGEGEEGIRTAVIIAGLLGAGGLFALTVWSSGWAYPLNSGGRPLLSWPAFIPAPVEFGALTAAIGGLLMLFRNARLTQLHHSAFDMPEVERASQDCFVLAIACDAGLQANAVLSLLARAGATHSRLVTP